VHYDVVIRSALLYDGSGAPPAAGDLAIQGDRIAAVGAVGPGPARTEIDAAGLAAAPGFINMLSWANAALIVDGRSQSDVRQGVTLEVMGEGRSMGPLTADMKAELLERQGDLKFDIAWTTLGEYLDYLARRGVTPNVASFVGATSVRLHVLGHVDRAPTAGELDAMRALVRQAMAEGALGVSSALVYAPACFAAKEELIALAEAAAASGGLYISHIRDEGAGAPAALDEFLTIVRRSGARGEIYHLKVSGRSNWHLMAPVIAAIEGARAGGLPVTADMYPYAASSTGLDSTLPGWAHEGGPRALIARLKEPAIRERMKAEMSLHPPEDILLVSFKSEALKPLTGRSLAAVAAARGRTAEETVLDLLLEDDSRVGAVFFSMSEANVRRVMALPWVSFGSDAASLAPEGVFLRSSTHPRAYGTFARVLGKYVREEKIIPLAEAIRRMTSLPATTLRLERRGRLRPGYFADVVVFDPATIQDHATFEAPHQYATGVRDVFVNGIPALRDGSHTGATPGRVVRGPGWRRA
jgi:N-acyl-D-amino-acid deacylase